VVAPYQAPGILAANFVQNFAGNLDWSVRLQGKNHLLKLISPLKVKGGLDGSI